MNLSFEKKIKIAFALIFAGIILIGIMTLWTYRTINKVDHLVEHNHKVLYESQQTLNYVQNTVLSCGGYLITNQSIYLKQFTAFNYVISIHLNNLKNLTKNNHAQQLKIDFLTKLINERTALSIQTFQLKKQNGYDETKALINSGNGKRYMDEINSAITDIQTEENNLLKQGQISQDRNFTFFNLSFIMLLGSISILLSLIFCAIKHNTFSKQRVKDKLIKTNKELIRKKIHFNQSLDMLFTLTVKGFLRDLNGAFEKEIGFSGEELRLTPFINFVHAQDKEATLAIIKEIIEGQDCLNFEFRLRCKNDNYIWLQFNAVVYEDMVYATARNITQQKYERECLEAQTLELKNMNKEIESFSYSVSHDLRTPLRAIQGFSNILLEDFSEKLNEEEIKTVEIIIKNSIRMSELIDDLLAFSRLGKGGIKKQDVNMNAVAQLVIYEMKTNEPNIKQNIILNPLHPTSGDSALLKQVWVNLISNAIKYSRLKSDSEIDIGSTEKGNEIIYYIKDNGVGFDMQYYDKLFGVFQRLHGEDEFEGTGVGLAIVQKIIGHHGGRVWAEAKVNEGATFYFSLPSINYDLKD